MQDPAVQAAITALRAAALAVNKDDDVVSLVIALDVRFGKKGLLTTHVDICSCPDCLDRLEFAIHDTIGGARRNVVGRRTHGAKLHS